MILILINGLLKYRKWYRIELTNLLEVVFSVYYELSRKPIVLKFEKKLSCVLAEFLRRLVLYASINSCYQAAERGGKGYMHRKPAACRGVGPVMMAY